MGISVSQAGRAIPAATPSRPSPGGSRRDHRIDLARGLALGMIFVDHMPHNDLNLVTLHSYSFCDAAEVFVLLAGTSSTFAYGRVLASGLGAGVQRVLARCARIYVTHIFLIVATLLVGAHVAVSHPDAFPSVGPILALGHRAPWLIATLQAMPALLDILPLYVVLLAAFPLIDRALRASLPGTIAASVAVWATANLVPGLDLPNATDPNGWYFNPFTWQLAYVLGAALGRLLAASERGALPRVPGLAAACWIFLAFAAIQSVPWTQWGLPSLRPFDMPTPDKSSLAPLRVLDILAVVYLVFSDPRTRVGLDNPLVAWIARAGRHSLEVFAAGSLLALAGRLAFLSYGCGLSMQVVVNVVGLGSLGLIALALEWTRRPPTARGTAETPYPGASVVLK